MDQQVREESSYRESLHGWFRPSLGVDGWVLLTLTFVFAAVLAFRCSRQESHRPSHAETTAKAAQVSGALLQ